MAKFVAFLNDETGASAAEYVLILAVIGTAVAAACVTFGASLAGSLNAAGAFITSHNMK